MNTDPRRLVLPKHIENDEKAVELVSAWFCSGSVYVMTKTGAKLDSHPEFVGEILAAIGNNAALSAEQLAKADRIEMLARMKAALDKSWEAMVRVKGEYYPPPSGQV